MRYYYLIIIINNCMEGSFPYPRSCTHSCCDTAGVDRPTLNLNTDSRRTHILPPWIKDICILMDCADGHCRALRLSARICVCRKETGIEEYRKITRDKCEKANNDVREYFYKNKIKTRNYITRACMIVRELTSLL
ncbi:hypothetical protein PUN28_013275 [Cardiocondyla obscurior]|uniref:Uncharacterized protein n=1 Tax=Cardiocondyla obscurior TaxID=286306 RepID=A0AAW2F7Q5_9HYME